MNPAISTDITIRELLDCYPQLLQTFMNMGLKCVGCPTEAFHTLEDVALEYHLGLDQLYERIFDAIGDNVLPKAD